MIFTCATLPPSASAAPPHCQQRSAGAAASSIALALAWWPREACRAITSGSMAEITSGNDSRRA